MVRARTNADTSADTRADTTPDTTPDTEPGPDQDPAHPTSNPPGGGSWVWNVAAQQWLARASAPATTQPVQQE